MVGSISTNVRGNFLIKFDPEKQAPRWEDKEAWDLWFKSFIEYHKKDKRPNTYNIIFPVVVDLIKQKEKIKPRVLIRLVRKQLPDLKGSQISRAIRRMISYGILEYEHKKSYKNIIKGHYWKSHVR
jgi:predicted transcriptional regulator